LTYFHQALVFVPFCCSATGSVLMNILVWQRLDNEKTYASACSSF